MAKLGAHPSQDSRMLVDLQIKADRLIPGKMSTSSHPSSTTNNSDPNPIRLERCGDLLVMVGHRDTGKSRFGALVKRSFRSAQTEQAIKAALAAKAGLYVRPTITGDIGHLNLEELQDFAEVD